MNCRTGTHTPFKKQWRLKKVNLNLDFTSQTLTISMTTKRKFFLKILVWCRWCMKFRNHLLATWHMVWNVVFVQGEWTFIIFIYHFRFVHYQWSEGLTDQPKWLWSEEHYWPRTLRRGAGCAREVHRRRVRTESSQEGWYTRTTKRKKCSSAHKFVCRRSALKPCSHVTSAFALNVRNAVYGNKWLCSHFKNGTAKIKDKRERRRYVWVYLWLYTRHIDSSEMITESE